MLRQFSPSFALLTLLGTAPACLEGSSSSGNTVPQFNPPSGGSNAAGTSLGSAGASPVMSSGGAGNPATGGVAAGGAGSGGVDNTGGNIAAGGTGGAAAGAGGTMPSGPLVDMPGESCAGMAIHLGEMQIFPNEWNDPRAETCVYLNADGTFGWHWVNGDFSVPVGPDMPGLMVNKDWPNYPELEFGINPWNKQGLDRSTTTLLPKKLGEVNEASMTVDVATEVSGGKWNLAFELWLADNNPETHPGSKAVAEVMVFFGNEEGYYPSEPKTNEKLNDGEHEYVLYESRDDWGDTKDQKYRQYRLSNGGKAYSGKLNIGKFLQHYVEQGFSKDAWLTRFELGNEVYTGAQGKTVVKSVSFSVNGETRQAKTMP
ncbi:MAG TPA: hypothetical protein VHB79_39650 [Polyangiaceae bacterium]|nr:hypothetical protein [Polyangiaceae bacterium]